MAVHIRNNSEVCYTEVFDEIMGEHFGMEFETYYNVLPMSFVTTRCDGKKMTPTMVKVGKSISKAIMAGRDE